MVILLCIVNNTAAHISEAAHPCHFNLNNLVTTVYCAHALHIVVTLFFLFVILCYVVI